MSHKRGRKTTPVATRLEDPEFDHLMALALRLGADPAEIIRRLLQNGLAANPVTSDEVSRARRRRTERARGELPGLVVPTSPLAAAGGGSSGSAEVHCLADWAAGQAEGRRWRDSNPRCASPAPRRIRKTRAA